VSAPNSTGMSDAADPSDASARGGQHRKLARSTLIFSVATGLSRVLGLVREMVAAYYFGINGKINAFTVAFQIPNLVRALVADTALSGAFVPVFGRARHVVQRREWEDATHPHERNRASYLQENIVPLGEAGLVDAVDGEAEIAPGVRVVPTPGHTAGHQSVLIGSPGGPKALFLGDVVPTAVHVKLPWVMSYDLEPARTVETKRALFTRALAEDWLLVWGHDKDHAAGRLGLDKDGAFVVRELIDL